MTSSLHPVHIYNKNQKYINVTTAIYNIDIPKEGLIIQENGDGSFFLKNGNVLRFIHVEDVEYPMIPAIHSNTIKEKVDYMVNKISDYASEDYLHISMVNEADLVFESSVQNDMNNRQISSLIAYDDVAARDTNNDIFDWSGYEDYWNNIERSVRLHLPNNDETNRPPSIPNIGDITTVCRQTKEYIKIPFGKTIIGMVTARLVATSIGRELIDANSNIFHVVSRVGFFDNQRFADFIVHSNYPKTGQGIYIGYDGTNSQLDDSNDPTVFTNELFIGIRTLNTPVDKIIPQDEWNTDPMDGTGASKINLDPHTMYTFVFVFGSIHGSSIKLGVYDKGQIYVFHEMEEQLSIDRFDADTALPIRYEIETDTNYVIDAAEEVWLEHKNASVYSLEKHVYPSVMATFTSTNSSHIDGVANSSINEDNEFVVASLRLKEDYIRSKLRITGVEINILDDSTQRIEWVLAVNPHWHPLLSDDDQYTYVTKEDAMFMSNSIAAFGITPYKYGSSDYADIIQKGLPNDGQPYESSGINAVRSQDYIIASGICNQLNTFVDLSNNNHFLLANMQGVPDVARVIITKSTTNLNNLRCTLRWEEYN